MVGKGFKFQTAMEYLVSYGWVILILGIVVYMLYSLGILTGAPQASSCSPKGGYVCTVPILSHITGNAIMKVSQSSGTDWATANFMFVPSGTPSTSIQSDFVGPNEQIVTTGLASGQTITINIPVNTMLTSTAPVNVGETYSGFLWAMYAIPGYMAPASNPAKGSTTYYLMQYAQLTNMLSSAYYAYITNSGYLIGFSPSVKGRQVQDKGALDFARADNRQGVNTYLAPGEDSTLSISKTISNAEPLLVSMGLANQELYAYDVIIANEQVLNTNTLLCCGFCTTTSTSSSTSTTSTTSSTTSVAIPADAQFYYTEMGAVTFKAS